MPQGSILGPLPFLIYINDLNNAIADSVVHHFADDTNITFSHKSLKKINKFINHGLSVLVQWLRANRISLNTNKTKFILFRTKNKKITKNPNLRISGQKIDTLKQTKYLGIYLDEGLKWKSQTEQIKSKPSRGCGLIAKLRYYIKRDLLRTVYFAIFDSIMRYALQVWGQNKNATFKEIEKLQNKAIRIMCFKSKLEPTKPLYLRTLMITLRK